MQKKYKIAIVKFCLYIVRNCNQSYANFKFLKFKVQSLDVATLQGAKGSQQGPQGPSPPQELEGWARSAQIF